MKTLDIAELRQCVPKHTRNNITQPLVDKINDIITNEDIKDEYRDNILGYLDVLKGGKYKFLSYIHAVKYVSYKLRGDTNISAYSKTFPDRIATYRANGVTDYSPWVASYNKSKLVAEIFERSMIPTHVLNADIYQKAINVQAELMVYATSEKVRTEAANSLLNHLKRPETAKIELDIKVGDNSAISDLDAKTRELVKIQSTMIANGGMTAKEVAHQKLVTEYVEDNNIIEGELVDG